MTSRLRTGMPPATSPRAHLVAIVLLSLLTFAYGFMSAFPSAPGQAEVSEVADDQPHGATLPVRAPPRPGKYAVFSRVLHFPFESVLRAWEGGPPDPNFIKEEVKVEFHGSEERKMKTIYTKNPLPYVIRKTLIRDEQFVFEESQSIDLEKRFSASSCDNKVLESIVQAHRSASMRADPNNPNWTIFEQSMTVSISGVLGQTVKTQLESFAEGLFLSAAESGTNMLETTLAEEAARISAAAHKADGGGVWWTGGAETVPGTNLHTPEPAVPEDSSSGFLSDTLESWTSWMWPAYDAQKGPEHKTRTGSVWWYEGDEDGAWGDIVIEPLPVSAVADGTCGSGAGAEPAAADHQTRRPLQQIARLARQAGSPAVMLAGIAAHVVSVGGEHNDQGAAKPLETDGNPLQEARRLRPRGPLGSPLRSHVHKELAEELQEGKAYGTRFPLQPFRRVRQGVGAWSSGASGAVAAFVSANLD